jgi:predicted DNA-binding protein
MSTARSMVLRSVHLPPEMDERLRTLAFSLRVSKADLIRGFVAKELERIEREFGRELSERDRERLLQSLGSSAELPEPERRRGEETMRRMRVAAEESALSRS